MNSILRRFLFVPSMASVIYSVIERWEENTPFGGTVYRYESGYRGYSYHVVNCPVLGEFHLHHDGTAWTDRSVDLDKIIRIIHS